MSVKSRISEIERHAATRIRPVVKTHPIVKPYRDRCDDIDLKTRLTDLEILDMEYSIGYAIAKDTGDTRHLNEIVNLAESIADSLGGEKVVIDTFTKTRENLDRYWDIFLEQLGREADE